jgi:hypothetical protein
VTREGGIVLFSTYSDGIWPERLAWFEAQAAEGLVGAVDRAASRDMDRVSLVRSSGKVPPDKPA